MTIFDQKNEEVDTVPLSEAAIEILREKSATPHEKDDLVFPYREQYEIS